MSEFEITRQIVVNNALGNAYTDKNNKPRVLEPKRLLALWSIICAENESEKHLVSKQDWGSWVSFRDRINKNLGENPTDERISNALKDISSILISGIQDVSQEEGYKNLTGYWSENKKMFHARLK